MELHNAGIVVVTCKDAQRFVLNHLNFELRENQTTFP